MEITILGYVLIPVAVLVFIIRPDALFYFMVFFSTFLAAAVVNIKSITFGLQPSYLFGMLWIIHLVFKYIRTPPVIDRRARGYLIFIGLVWAVALYSLNLPLIFKNRILVHGPSDLWGNKPLNLSISNFTQFLYLTFVLMIAAFTMLEAGDLGRLVKALKILLLSTSFAIAWGFLQMLCFYTGSEYPYFLFNNSISYAQLWNQTAGGLPRITSIFTEPSAYSSVLLMVLPIVLVLWKNRIYIVRKIYLDLLLGCLFVTIILTTSTTAYIGFVFMFFFILVYHIFLRRVVREPAIQDPGSKTAIREYFRILMIVFLLFVSVSVVLIAAFGMDIERFTALLRSMTLEKASSSSGIERGEGFSNGIRILFESYLLGVGWGSNRTFDLGTTLLSNTGVIGFSMFVALLFQILSNCSRVYRNTDNFAVSSIGLALLISTGTVLFIMFISGPDIILLCFWILAGLSLSLRENNQSFGNAPGSKVSGI